MIPTTDELPVLRQEGQIGKRGYILTIHITEDLDKEAMDKVMDCLKDLTARRSEGEMTISFCPTVPPPQEDRPW